MTTHASPVTTSTTRITGSAAERAERIAQVARDVAAPAAEAVDRDARFPSEALTALRAAGLLSTLVPIRFGGAGARISEVADACFTLGQHCSAAGMVYAMHQIQVACIVRHAGSTPFFESYQADLVERQLLIASATSEIGVGGDVRSSICSVLRDGETFTLTKNAPVISYGEHADAILATARRDAGAAAGDQVLALLQRDDMTLTRTSGWDTLGFRGTCSPGFKLEARASCDQILADPYADISSRTMLPVSHILWTSLWLGIATSAVAKARAFIRAEARKSPDRTPVASVRLAETVNALHGMRAMVHDATREYEHCMDDPDALAVLGFTIRMNNLKLSCSSLVVEIVSQAMLICGMSGYRHDSPLSLGRHLRDAFGAALMINNDRIYRSNASLLLVAKDD